MKIKRIEKMNYIIDHEFEPVRAHSLDAGLDLRTPVDVTIPAHGSAIADLGIHFEIPEGCRCTAVRSESVRRRCRFSASPR